VAAKPTATIGDEKGATVKLDISRKRQGMGWRSNAKLVLDGLALH